MYNTRLRRRGFSTHHAFARFVLTDPNYTTEQNLRALASWTQGVLSVGVSAEKYEQITHLRLVLLRYARVFHNIDLQSQNTTQELHARNLAWNLYNQYTSFKGVVYGVVYGAGPFTIERLMRRLLNPNSLSATKIRADISINLLPSDERFRNDYARVTSLYALPPLTVPRASVVIKGVTP